MSNVGYPWGSNLTNISSSDSATLNFTQATDGDTYGTYIRMGKGNRYNAGTITITASNIKVQDRESHIIQDYGTYIGSVYVGSSSNKQNLQNNGSVSFNVNYYMGSGTENDVDIVFTISLNNDYVMDGTITAYWSGVSQDCNYSFKTNSLQFNGASQTILNSYDTTHLLVSGQSATNAGNYICTLTVKDQYKAMWCLRNDEGEMTDLISKNWSIEKVTPEFTIADETININREAAAQIKGVFPGYSKYTIRPLGSSVVEVLGYDDRDGAPKLRLKGVAAGTCNITVYSTATTNYYSNNYTFSVTVEDNRDAQNWYYENTSVTVGNTAYIYRQYPSGGNKVSTKKPSVNGWNSSIISATIYNDGRIAIEGKQIGTSSLTISIDGDDNYKDKSDTITVTVVDKQDQNWTFQNIPSEMNVGDSKNALFDGGTSSSNFSSISVSTSPVGIINTSLSTNKKTITLEALKAGTCELTITVPEDSSYKEKTQTASITVKKNSQNVSIPNVEVAVDGTEKIIYEHGYSPASGNPTFNIRSGDEQYISINSEKPPTVTGKKVGSAIIYFNDAGNYAYEKVENYPIEVTVTEDTRGEQDWAFSSPQDIELGQTLEVVHTGGAIWGEVNVGVEDVTLLEASYNSSTAKLIITANNTISGTTSIRVEAAGNEYFKPHYQDIEININKHKQTWTLNPSEVAIEIGESANIEVEGEMFGSANTYVAPAKIYMDVEPHFGETPPYFTITGKQTINRGQLTVSSTESTTYEDRTQTAYITVGAKKDQTWEANISETTIKISEFVDISVFGSIYGGLYFSTESSLIKIINKTDTGCRVVAGNSTGTAKVRLYSPGTTAYNSKEVYITIHIKDDLIWVECNPHIYKNGKWIEMSPKIYKNGKWLSGIIKKYISKGDIYGK